MQVEAIKYVGKSEGQIFISSYKLLTTTASTTINLLT